MAVKNNPTAWGNLIFRVAEADPTGEMPEALEQLGWIVENSISIDVQRGTKLELKETGGVLRDSVETEPTLKIGMDIIGIPEEMRKKFWDTEDKEGKIRVKSLVNTSKYAIGILNPKIKGSDTLEVPNTEVFMSPLLTDDKGYTATLEFTILKSKAEHLFDMGKVGVTPEV